MTFNVRVFGLLLCAFVLWTACTGCSRDDTRGAFLRRMKCRANLEMIHGACVEYAAEHEGRYPNRLADIVPPVSNLKVFLCPDSESSRLGSAESVDAWASYQLVSNLTTSVSADTLLCCDRCIADGIQSGCLVTVGGQTVWCSPEELRSGEWRQSLWKNEEKENQSVSNSGAGEKKGWQVAPP
jgi:hypothetical protein